MRFSPGRVLLYAAVTAGAAFMVLPFYWMIITSLKTPSEAILFPPTWWPHELTLYGYRELFTKLNFLRYIQVSVIMTLLTLAGVLITSVLAAYAFSWLHFRGRESLFMLFIAVMMIPMPVYVIPLYVMIQSWGWMDTFAALTVPWMVNVFTIFLLRQHFRSLPRDLFDAAVLDGCSHLDFLVRILLPLSKPVLVTVIIFDIIGSWNAFMWPLMVTNSDRMRPIQVGLAYFAQGESTNYPALMAASTLAILPLVLLFFVAQRHIMESYARSGLKE